MAVEDLTTWTESDPSNYLTVASGSIAIDNMNSGAGDTWVYYDFGAGYWSGDWTIKFEYTTPASEDSAATSWIYPIYLCNSVDDPSALEGAGADFQGIIFLNSSGAARFPVFKVENGSRTTAYPTNLDWSTKYYITFERDDDAGASGTGQLTIRVYTVNYYGEAGAVEHDTVTLDCSAGEQNDFRYILLASGRGSGTAITDGLIENVDVGLVGTNYVDVSGSTTITFSSVATLEGTINLSGSTTITFSSTAILTSGPLTGAGAEKFTRYLVAFGNDSVSYESG